MKAINFTDYPLIVFLVFVFSWPMYKQLAKVFFGDNYEKLGQVLRYVLQSDWKSLKNGNYWEDWDASMSFKWYLAMCILWIASVSEGIVRWLYV